MDNILSANKPHLPSSTTATTSPPRNISSFLMKNHYKDINSIKSFVKDCSKFNEDLEILNYLNSGSCGIVYAGRLKRNPNNYVALKFILNKNLLQHKREQQNQHNIKRIQKEIALQTKLKHKNIVVLYGSYELAESSFCIVMELANYGDLALFQRILKLKYLSETFLAYIAKQILNALNFCHKSKIIHMDIKQQNILINDQLSAKLTDMSVSFSYASFPEGSQIVLPLAGTSLFMSPEVLNQKTIIVDDCEKIDLFSLGMLLYNLAFCEYPYGLCFEDKKKFDVIREKIAKNELVIPVRHSQMFRFFISGLLNKNIKHRMNIKTALEHPWIKASNILFDEKEKISDLRKFLTHLLRDNITAFNVAVGKK